MKISTQFLNRMQLAVVMLLSGSVACMQAATHYVRMAGDATSWSNISGADILTGNSVELVATDTYYFAKGTYVLTATAIDPITSLPAPITPALTTGAIYGGFSGAESVIDLAARATSDKDANGIVEPWEFTNETIFKGSVPASDITGASKRMLTVTGGEVNGVTFFDFYYFGDLLPAAVAYPGAIILGVVSTYPALADDVVEKAGKMICCTVRKIKAGGMGPIMLTNQNSLVDKCLFEECSTEGLNPNGGGGAIYTNNLGGKIRNSVLRNNLAKFGGSNSGRGGAIWAGTNTLINPENNTIVENCLIYNNTAMGYGGAMRFDGIANKRGIEIINCTMANNLTAASGAGLASVELIQSGLIVNSIVVGDTKGEIRFHSPNNFAASNIAGELVGSAASPGTDMITGKLVADMGFKNPTTFNGNVGSPGDDFFDQAAYDALRKANFTINSATSPAVTTTALSSLPTEYTVNPALLIPYTTVPATDLMGVSRTGGTYSRTLGAYQFTGATALGKVYSDKALNVIALQNSILINDQEGKEASFYSASGQLIKKANLKSNNEIVPLTPGFYIVSVNGRVGKVIVK